MATSLPVTRKATARRRSPPPTPAEVVPVKVAPRLLEVDNLPEAWRADEADGNIVEKLDRYLHSTLARATLGISPAAVGLAFADWWTHLALSPGKQAELVGKAVGKWARLVNYASDAIRLNPHKQAIEPLPQDRRFHAPEWQQYPFNVIYQAFLLHQQWLHNATTGVRGVSKHHQDVVTFVGRQMLDMWSPSNSPWTNPQVWRAAAETKGLNFVRGAGNWFDDVVRAVTGAPPRGAERFEVGRDVAVTPGNVVLRNRLMELIQYSPATGKVRPEPVLVVPAWIMKYYILDLSPHNSLIRYLVEQGFTVFAISWRNPGPIDRELGMDDYLQHGLMAAVDAVETIVPKQRVHAVGYCLGGTLLSIGASAMARDGDARLATLTLFATQTDFTEPGELGMFIDDSQLAFLEDTMWAHGYLDATQMAGAFQLLRSNDLIWSRMVSQYLVGEDPPINDLMAWNADSTRMPYRMHSEYLRRLFLRNDLAEGRYTVGGRPVALSDIAVPMFVVGTTVDHIAPWRSVYRIHAYTDTELTFVLTNGGHNAGVVSPPGKEGRAFKAYERTRDAKYVGPDAFLDTAPVYQGSWWPAWSDWLEARSGRRVSPPAMGAPQLGYPILEPAPGTYVLQK